MNRKRKLVVVAQNRLRPSDGLLTPKQLKIIEGGAAIRDDPENVEWAYMARQLVQCTLPHRNPGDVPVWTRRNGNLTLGVQPGYDFKTGKSLGFPYGSVPRLLLFWIVTEAKTTQNRQLELGSSLAKFMRAVGLSPDTGGGKRGDANRLRDQMQRLFRARISFHQTGGVEGGTQGERWLDMQIAPKGELWWDTKQPEQTTLWKSWIMLGEEFYEAIMAAPVPMDMRALRILKQSPFALDVYAVMNYRAHTTKEAVFLSWDLLRHQLGTEISNTRDFKKEMIPALQEVMTVAPHLKIERAHGGLVLHPSRGAIAARPQDNN
jgi:hypothetical protein